MADFGATELDAFRSEARAWLEENFPPALKQDPSAQMAAMMGGPESAEVKVWRERIGAKGWGTPTWPKAYGGGGLSRAEGRVLAEEMAKIGARNPIGGMGVMMFGPTLLEVGTEEQKRRHIPPIVKGEESADAEHDAGGGVPGDDLPLGAHRGVDRDRVAGLGPAGPGGRVHADHGPGGVG